MSKGWDNAALKKLKALTGKGLSTSEIGKRLGMSKNAIVGKLNRLGWNAKAGGASVSEPVEKKPVKKAEVTAKPKKATAKPVKEDKKSVEKKTAKTVTKVVQEAPKAKEKAKVAPKAEPKVSARSSKASAKDLEVHQRIVQHSLEMANLKSNQCRWPIGDPDSEHFHFCGETVFVGKPYCYEHCKQAYQFTPPKKK